MERELRAVLVGCGGISQVWLDEIAGIPGLEVVGLVDLEEAAASRRADEYGLRDALVSTDLKATLENAHPDVVFDCTVPEAHVHVTLEALRHGCHVLGEKPMADSLANARRMVAAAQDARRLYAVTQNYRYGPGIRRLAGFLESGGIGRITTVHSDFYIGAHFGGFRDRMQHVLLLDMAIHTFDAARFVTGADPVSVTCQEWNPAASWYDHGASAVAVFQMSGGIVYTYRGSWCAEGLNTAWAGEWRVIGERGSAQWDGGEGFQAQVVTETGGFLSTCQDVDVPPVGGGARSVEKVHGHASLIQEFVHSIRTGSTPETICTDNIKSLAMVLRAVESAELGDRVEVEVAVRE